MHKEQRQQTHALLRQSQIDQALFARPESVKWLTGFAAPVQLGIHLQASSYPLVWYDAGQYHLITVDSYAELASPYRHSVLNVSTYQGYRVDRPIEIGKRLLELFLKLSVPKPGVLLGLQQQ